MAANQNQAAAAAAVGMQASPPHGYLSPTHLSPNGLPGWLASTAAVTVPATATADMKLPATDNR